MAADITPEQARSETVANLISMANLYRVGSGAHTVVINELNRREESRRNIRKLLVTLGLGLIGLLFWWLRGIL